MAQNLQVSTRETIKTPTNDCSYVIIHESVVIMN